MIYLVQGAPYGKKYDFLENKIRDGDVVYDFNRIISAMTNVDSEDADHLLDMMNKFRHQFIRQAVRDNKRDYYLIVTFIGKNLKRQLVGIPYRTIKLDDNILDCLKSLEEDTSKDVSKKDLFRRLIEEYFIKYSDNKKYYKTKDWQYYRSIALDRDDNVCQECLKNGLVRDAQEVHHVNMVSLRPDLIYEVDNLVSLCKSCHQKMHDQLRMKLSIRGEELRKEINKRRNIL